MKKYSSILITVAIVALSATVGSVSTYFLGHDNPIEETAEKVIESKTGLDVDLTPSSKKRKVTSFDIKQFRPS